jgi:PAS domain-containing protein
MMHRMSGADRTTTAAQAAGAPDGRLPVDPVSRLILRAFGVLPARRAESVNGRLSVIEWRRTDGGAELIASTYDTEDFLHLYTASFFEIASWSLSLQAMGDDTFHCVALAFTSRHGVGIFRVVRGYRQEGFDSAEAAFLQAQCEHLQRVLSVRGEIAAHRRTGQLTDLALDAMGLVNIIATGDGGILKFNAAAEAILKRADGLIAKGGVLSVIAQRQPMVLEGWLRVATRSSGSASSTVRVQRGDETDLPVTIAPPIGQPAGTAIIKFRDSDVEEQPL